MSSQESIHNVSPLGRENAVKSNYNRPSFTYVNYNKEGVK